jgi:hypothetical protein
MRAKKLIISVLAILLATSCETHYRMVTTLGRNGKVHREVYASDIQPFTSKGVLKNPFLFDVSSDWQITHFDTAVEYNFFGEKENFNVKISKDENFIELYSKEIQCDENRKSLAAPQESLQKKFRWFYTYYSFKAVYKQLDYESPVPIENHLTKEEQILFTQGNMNNYKVENGWEIFNYLEKINNNFFEWCSRNFFEINIGCIKKIATRYDLDTVKETIYKEVFYVKKEDFLNITPETVCSTLDSFYKTNYFSQLYKDNKEVLENDVNKNKAVAMMEYIGNTISYELVIPDRLLKTNAPIANADTLIWKVDGIRLLFDDYSLTAEYRVVNRWAVLVSWSVIFFALGCLICRKIKRWCL